MKRPILGLLAAATLSLTAVGTAPARAAAPPSAPQAVAATPADDDDDGDDGDRGRRRRCAGLIVVCLG